MRGDRLPVRFVVLNVDATGTLRQRGFFAEDAAQIHMQILRAYGWEPEIVTVAEARMRGGAEDEA